MNELVAIILSAAFGAIAGIGSYVAICRWEDRKDARQGEIVDTSRSEIQSPAFLGGEPTWQQMLEALPSNRVKLCMADYQKNITDAKKSKKKHSHWQEKLNRCQAELLRRATIKGDVK